MDIVQLFQSPCRISRRVSLMKENVSENYYQLRKQQGGQINYLYSSSVIMSELGPSVVTRMEGFF